MLAKKPDLPEVQVSEFLSYIHVFVSIDLVILKQERVFILASSIRGHHSRLLSTSLAQYRSFRLTCWQAFGHLEETDLKIEPRTFLLLIDSAVH